MIDLENVNAFYSQLGDGDAIQAYPKAKSIQAKNRKGRTYTKTISEQAYDVKNFDSSNNVSAFNPNNFSLSEKQVMKQKLKGSNINKKKQERILKEAANSNGVSYMKTNQGYTPFNKSDYQMSNNLYGAFDDVEKKINKNVTPKSVRDSLNGRKVTSATRPQGFKKPGAKAASKAAQSVDDAVEAASKSKLFKKMMHSSPMKAIAGASVASLIVGNMVRSKGQQSNSELYGQRTPYM